MRVYVVEYFHYNESAKKWDHKVSQEAYPTLTEARAFVMSRSDNPVECEENIFRGKEYDEYRITEISFKTPLFLIRMCDGTAPYPTTVRRVVQRPADAEMVMDELAKYGIGAEIEEIPRDATI